MSRSKQRFVVGVNLLFMVFNAVLVVLEPGRIWFNGTAALISGGVAFWISTRETAA